MSRPKSAGSTIGHRGISDEPYIALMSGVLRQAAMDYKYAVDWLATHSDMDQPRKYKAVESLKKDVIRFTRSDLFDFAVGDTIEPETFLKVALKTPIRQNR